jgi:hypothetical protein
MPSAMALFWQKDSFGKRHLQLSEMNYNSTGKSRFDGVSLESWLDDCHGKAP